MFVECDHACLQDWFSIPCDRTSHRFGGGYFHPGTSQYLVERFGKVVRFGRIEAGGAVGVLVIDRSKIPQVPLAIYQENLRGDRGAEIGCDSVVWVME